MGLADTGLGKASARDGDWMTTVVEHGLVRDGGWADRCISQGGTLTEP